MIHINIYVSHSSQGFKYNNASWTDSAGEIINDEMHVTEITNTNRVKREREVSFDENENEETRGCKSEAMGLLNGTSVKSGERRGADSPRGEIGGKEEET